MREKGGGFIKISYTILEYCKETRINVGVLYKIGVVILYKIPLKIAFKFGIIYYE